MRINTQPSRPASRHGRDAGFISTAALVAGVLAVTTGAGADSAQAQGAAAAPAAGNCAVSRKVDDAKASGSGPHQVVIEYNCSPGISTGTIYRPADLKGNVKYPILVWGEGGCSQNGLSNQAAMSEIASHGYFVVADGTPTPEGRGQSPGMGNGDMTAQGKPLIGYIDWAIAENSKPTSPVPVSHATISEDCGGDDCSGPCACQRDFRSGRSDLHRQRVGELGLRNLERRRIRRVRTAEKRRLRSNDPGATGLSGRTLGRDAGLFAEAVPHDRRRHSSLRERSGADIEARSVVGFGAASAVHRRAAAPLRRSLERQRDRHDRSE